MTTDSPAARQRILLVEDDDGVRRSTHLMLQAQGFEVRSFASAAALTADPAIGEAAWLVADYRLSDSNGLEVLGALRASGWQGRALLFTAFSSATLRDAAEAAGFEAVLEKPVRPLELSAALGCLTGEGTR
ncbi:response regulator [Sphingomonas sp. AOB5]|uniref:response regulator n=1 Tax=Sphingomonas sp. AOB5 TaxID=3034017 RepID=UPI0023F744BA|nr:response regulator [Sphingomonas sp. AOB5]MDF7777756.1 response regulator [Sphingomonas sp. AOB5]